jgi:hypothetical protein
MEGYSTYLSKTPILTIRSMGNWSISRNTLSIILPIRYTSVFYVYCWIEVSGVHISGLIVYSEAMLNVYGSVCIRVAQLISFKRQLWSLKTSTLLSFIFKWRTLRIYRALNPLAAWISKCNLVWMLQISMFLFRYFFKLKQSYSSTMNELSLYLQ